MSLSTDPSAIKSYQAGFAAGQQVAARVDVMRWQSQHYYSKYRAAVRLRGAEAIEAAKIGFMEGFEAGQNGKAQRYGDCLRPGVRLSS